MTGNSSVVFSGLVVASLLLWQPQPVAAQASRTILILDASGSMWGQIAGEAKITIAQRVIGQLLESLPPEEALGLFAYGHRVKGDCADIEELVPAGQHNAGAILAAVQSIQPKGKTPLSASVVAAAEALKFEENRATVILVSDGRETCDLDPCAVARKLEQTGADFTAHVIGFDVADPEEIRQLSCLAEGTGGQFFTASNATELREAMTAAVEAAAKPAPVQVAQTNRAVQRSLH